MKGYFGLLLLAFGAYATDPTTNLIKLNPLVAQISLMQEFKARAQATTQHVSYNKAAKSPTLQHMKATEGMSSRWFGWLFGSYASAIQAYKAHYKELVDSVIEKEHQYCDEYYVFYHGQSNRFRVLQDFLKAVYALISINAPLKDFEFLRMRHKAEKTLNQDSFIDKEESVSLGHVYWMDHRSDLVKNMICVNLALFGNIKNSGEQTFNYFKNSASHHAVDAIDSFLEELFAHFGFDVKYIDELQKIGSIVSTTEGNLFQIFIPKEKVDQYVYLSHAFGTPYRTPIASSVFDFNKKRHTRISTNLEAYTNNPNAISGFDGLQARILLSQDGMLDPESGIKIFRYTTAANEQMQKYKNSIKEIAQKVFSDAIDKKTVKNLEDTRLNKLLSLMKNK